MNSHQENNLKNRQQLRTLIKTKRSSLSCSFQRSAAQQLTQRLSCHHRLKKAKHIAIYLSTNGELNTMPFIQWCWKHNKKTYLPVIHPFSKGHLLFLEYNPNTLMTTNKYGILEPKLNVESIRLVQHIDIIFTPLVAFDSTGARLGMGGGFYDRTLQHWHKHYISDKSTIPYPIGLAHECQKVESVPVEPWDIPLPEIITPEQKYTF